MSNPYDPNSNPYGGSEPGAGGYGQQGGGYGPPAGGGYGQGGGSYGSPYGQPGPYGDQPKKTDAVSIIGFVLSLTCCLSVIGAIMGFIGLGRTKGNQRKGRWAAITASIVGVVGTLVFAGGIVFIVFLAKNSITIDNAEVGQCADVTESDNTFTLLKKDCGDDHDAEITWVGTFGDVEGLPDTVRPTNPDDFTDAGASLLLCTALMDPADVDALGEDVEYQFVGEEIDNPASSDASACFVTRANGDKFTSKQLP